MGTPSRLDGKAPVSCFSRTDLASASGTGLPNPSIWSIRSKLKCTARSTLKQLASESAPRTATDSHPPLLMDQHASKEISKKVRPRWPGDLGVCESPDNDGRVISPLSTSPPLSDRKFRKKMSHRIKKLKRRRQDSDRNISAVMRNKTPTNPKKDQRFSPKTTGTVAKEQVQETHQEISNRRQRRRQGSRSEVWRLNSNVPQNGAVAAVPNLPDRGS